MRAEPDWLERDTGTADTPRPANDGGTRMSRFVSRSFLGFVLCAASVAAACAPPLSRSAAPPVAAPPAWWLFDGHIDVTVHYARAQWEPRAYDLVSGETGQTNLTRLAVGRVGGGFFTCDSAVRTAPRWPGLADCLAFASRLARAHAGRVVLASTAADVRAAQRRGVVAWMPSIEGGDQLDGDLSHLAALRAAGVRAFGLVYDQDNDLGDGAQAFVEQEAAPTHGGLSPLGARAVDELSRLGMLVDVAHAAESTALAVAARATLPVIATHTAAGALVRTPRNASDAVLRAIAATDGVVMVTFLPELTDATFAEWTAAGDAYWSGLKREYPGAPERVRESMTRWEQEHPRPTPSLAVVADHIEYVARAIGVRHVGLGSDFDGMDYTIPGLEDHRGVPALMAELQRRGWTDEDLAAIASGNILRVLEVADRVKVP